MQRTGFLGGLIPREEALWTGDDGLSNRAVTTPAYGAGVLNTVTFGDMPAASSMWMLSQPPG